MIALARRHRWLVGVLAVAALVRLATLIAYRPGLVFSDSWTYLRLARDGSPVGFAPDRPNGYSVFIDLLAWGDGLGVLVIAQQLAGLGAAVLVYAICRHCEVPQWASALAAAFVALDARLIAVHQHLLPEAFFALALLGAAWLVIAHPRSLAAVAAAGALLAAAAILRTVGVFAIPVFLAYLAWQHAGARQLAVATASMLIPLLLYGAGLQSTWGRFGLSVMDGWFLYGRTGEIVRCDGLDVAPRAAEVCRETELSGDVGAAYLVWGPQSPANRAYPGHGADAQLQRDSNRELGELGRAAIRDRPLAYAGIVARDFARMFVPGAGSGNSDSAITLPEQPSLEPPAFVVTARDLYLPGYVPAARAPSDALGVYGDIVRTPRPLLALALLAALAGLIRRVARRREIFLLAGSGTVLLLGSVATSEFIVRYLVPAIPLLLAAGAIACSRPAGLMRRT